MVVATASAEPLTMNLLPTRPRETDETDPRLDAALHYAIAIGAALVLLLPGARAAYRDWLGAVVAAGIAAECVVGAAPVSPAAHQRG
jgi:hypothetical protein